MTRIEFIHKYAEQIALITEHYDTYIGFARALPLAPEIDGSEYEPAFERPATEPITHMTLISGRFDNELHETLLSMGFDLANIVAIEAGTHPKLLISYRVPVTDHTEQASIIEKDARLLFESYISPPVRE